MIYRTVLRRAKKLFNCIILSKYIDRIVPITRNDFGSWRGYASFRMKEKLIKRIELLYDEEISRKKINKFIMNSAWVQDMLYRPPTENPNQREECMRQLKHILIKWSVRTYPNNV